jgi:hypothetical protein
MLAPHHRANRDLVIDEALAKPDLAITEVAAIL